MKRNLRLVASNGQLLAYNVIPFKGRKKQSPIPESTDSFTQVLRGYLNGDLDLELVEIALQKKLIEEGKLLEMKKPDLSAKLSLKIVKD